MKESLEVMEKPQGSGAVQDTAVLVLMSFLSSAINFLTTYVLAKKLGPESYGAWQVLMTVLWYLTVLDFGLNIGIVREAPYLLGKGDTQGYRRTAGTTLTGNLSFAVFEILCLSLIALFVPMEGYLRMGLPLLGFYMVIYHVSNFFHSLLYSHGGIRFWAFGGFVRNLLRLLAAALLWKQGLWVLLVAWIAAELPLLFLVRMANPSIRLILDFDKTVFTRLLWLGFPNFLLTFVQWQCRIGDRAVVALALGEKALGYYALASTFSSFLVMMTIQVSQAMYPRILRKYGETKDVASLKDYVLEPCRAVSWVFPFLIGAVLLLVPPFIRHFLPAYIEAIPVVRILAFMSFFLAVPQTQGILLLALEKQWLNLWIWCAVLGVNLVLAVVFISWGWGTTGVAVAMGVSWIVSFLIHFRFTLPYHLDSKQAWEFLLKLIAPLIYASFLLLFFGYGLGLFIKEPDTLDGLILTAFAVGYIPLLWRADRKYGVLSSIRAYIDRWRLRMA